MQNIKNLERALKALANKRRLAIIEYIKRRQSVSVGDIAAEIDLSIKATSKHLGVLSAANIVEKTQHSSRVFYRLAEHQESTAEHVIALM
ncbi:MAG: winged helix-turn-helix transcriptional regulator [Candidatus Harrisonbacteria bacterium]|nr:winged helix-turn-helix transcriptional regulator [Candidatus Harrisonbacteria bacterium]MBI2406619.1 winged helix-turn-helix transcriptional regulator [Candidatus Harrisonbacteria bacterium]